jgi:hypothetical protein
MIYRTSLPFNVTLLSSVLLAGLLFPAFAAPSSVLAPVPPLGAVTSFDEIGTYHVGVIYRNGSEIDKPDGWVGDFDDQSGIACMSMGMQNGRHAWLLHPPWHNGTGVSFQDFRLALPKLPSISLTGYTAMRADAVGKSDGVTFRVFVNGAKRYELNQADSQWRPYTVDLTDLAGTTVQIRFESDPGPQDNPGFDFGLWGDRSLNTSGYTNAQMTRPKLPRVSLSLLLSKQSGTVAPESGIDEGADGVTQWPDGSWLTYDGVDGRLSVHWTTPKAGDDSLLGSLLLNATDSTFVKTLVPLARDAHIEWATGHAPQPVSAKMTVLPESVHFVRTYRDGDTAVHVTVDGVMHAKSLVLKFTCDQPIVASLDLGTWGPAEYRKAINIPYCSYPVSYFPLQHIFAASFPDWTKSHATSLQDLTAHYDAKTDGTRNLLSETAVYTSAWSLDEVLPNIPNPRSPYRAELGTRVMLDIWGDSFSDIADKLDNLASYGITPAAAIIHNWQHGGYDNMLPMHVPANASLGGDDAMAALVSRAMKDDIRIALHENYIDYYPNYPGFTPADIALSSDGTQQKAWFNPGTKIQSFAQKPTVILRNATDQGAKIMATFHSNAEYLDVHSSVPPWFHVDEDATQPGASMFKTVYDVYQRLWSYERALHNGPVFGEGNRHWYWSGFLDGTEAQFGTGVPGNSGESAPLFVDFDLLKIHPLQLNHGMGYYERWWHDSPTDSASMMDRLDLYRLQEIAYGHEAFLGGGEWQDLPIAWLESQLVRPVTRVTATANPESITYLTGNRWTDSSDAAINGSLDRVRVKYDNGITVTANGSGDPLHLDSGIVLPRNGWLASGDEVTAYTALRQGVICDYASSPATGVFVNARNHDVYGQPGVVRIQPVSVTYSWAVGQTLPRDATCFVHFIPSPNPDNKILWQQDHALPSPTSAWTPGQTVSDGPYEIRVPDQIPDGTYTWVIGLVSNNERIGLLGKSDSDRRIVLGTLNVAGDNVSFVPVQPIAVHNDRINTKDVVIDFGTVRTNGSAWIHKVGTSWILQPMPTDMPFELDFKSTEFGSPATVTALGSTPHQVKTVALGAGWWKLPLDASSCYSWPATATRAAQSARGAKHVGG